MFATLEQNLNGHLCMLAGGFVCFEKCVEEIAHLNNDLNRLSILRFDFACASIAEFCNRVEIKSDVTLSAKVGLTGEAIAAGRVTGLALNSLESVLV